MVRSRHGCAAALVLIPEHCLCRTYVGVTDVAFGSWGYSLPTLPQRGKVTVQMGPVTNGTAVYEMEPTADLAVFSRFGYALATLDFNLDGIDDLVVSAPTR